MVWFLKVQLGAARIFGEPPFGYALALLENLFNRPERREADDAREGREEYVRDGHGDATHDDAENQEPPPAAGAEIVFAFDDDGVEDADDGEGADADGEAEEIILLKNFAEISHLW